MPAIAECGGAFAIATLLPSGTYLNAAQYADAQPAKGRYPQAVGFSASNCCTERRHPDPQCAHADAASKAPQQSGRAGGGFSRPQNPDDETELRFYDATS